MAGAEGRAIAGDHHHLYRGIAGYRLQRVGHGIHQGQGQRVARLRPVQGQRGDAGAVAAQQNIAVAGQGGWMGHGMSPSYPLFAGSYFR